MVMKNENTKSLLAQKMRLEHSVLTFLLTWIYLNCKTAFKLSDKTRGRRFPLNF